MIRPLCLHSEGQSHSKAGVKTELADGSDPSLGLVIGLEILPRARQSCEGGLSGMRKIGLPGKYLLVCQEQSLAGNKMGQ